MNNALQIINGRTYRKTTWVTTSYNHVRVIVRKVKAADGVVAVQRKNRQTGKYVVTFWIPEA